MKNIEKYKDEIIEEYQNLMKTTAIDGDGNRMNKAIKIIAYKHCGKTLMGASNPFIWLCEEYKEPILDEAEKTYLREVIRPFRCYVKYISKEIAFIEDRFRIKIVVKQFVKQSYDGYCEEWISLPSFKGDMYKGMELRRKYTLEELGL